MRWFCLSVTLCAVGFLSNAHAMNDQEYIAAMSAEHASDTPAANPMLEEGPKVPVKGEDVAYATVNGGTVTGYLSRPVEAEGPLPGIIVIHEWWGLNDNIRRMTDKLAGLGYQALAVDMYNGQSAETPDGARELMMQVFNDEDAAENNLRQAYEYLESQGHAARIGVIGWCFGGGWSLQTALMFPKQIDAAVMYYGRPVTDVAALKELAMPLIGFFGEEDQGITVEAVKGFENALKEAGVNAEIHEYPGAGHAFANPSGENYVPEAAGDAWKRTVKFLDEHLKSHHDEGEPAS